jgi:DtxR family Mn-dependent transcriptional regulator
MLKALEEAGLVRYRPYGGVQLTREGEALALRVQRRHRVIEVFLVEVLGMHWTEVHEEAEALEHAVSEKVLERMDQLLGRPTADPHGDPIPRADGGLPEGPLASLAGARRGERVVVVRVLEQGAEFLRRAERLGLRPGSVVEVLGRDEAGGVLRIAAGKRRGAVAIALAENVRVRPEASQPAPPASPLPARSRSRSRSR